MMQLQFIIGQREIRFCHQYLLAAGTIDGRTIADLNALDIFDHHRQHDQIGVDLTGIFFED